MSGSPGASGSRRHTAVYRRAVASAAVVLACAAWAFWPLDRSPVVVPALNTAERRTDSRAPALLDVAAFRSPLWVAPPEPPPPIAVAPPPLPPPPLKLQLIAIVSENGEYRAALYDPDTDRLVVVGPGDAIAGRKIERIGRSEVVVLDGSLARTLALRTEEGRP